MSSSTSFCIIGGLTCLCSAISWYKRAAEKGDKRAAQRLKSNGPMKQPGGAGVLHRDGGESSGDGKGNKDKDCVLM